MCLIHRIAFFLLMVLVPGTKLMAQPVRRDSLSEMSFRYRGRLNQLKNQVEQLVRGRTSFRVDSLVQQTRQLRYAPGQVIALCQTASVQLQQSPAQSVEPLVDDALRIIAQIHSFSELGWTMQQLTEIQRRNPDQAGVFSPVMTALGNAMKRMSPVDDQAAFRLNQRHSRRPDGINGNEGRPVFSDPNTFMDLAKPFIRGDRSSFKPAFTDPWLDSLLMTHAQTSPVRRQLTVQRQLRDTTRQLSRAYAQRGDYAKAYTYFLRYTAYKDSLAAEVTARQVALLHYRQATQKKEAQIKLLTREQQLRNQEAKQQKLVLSGLAILILLLLLFSLILIRINRQRRHANQQLDARRSDLEETLAELKTTQGQLIQSEKMAALGELTAGIAHEIQNPLNFVNNFSEVSTELIDELTSEQPRLEADSELQREILSDLRQNLQKIRQHGGRASAIVKGMLEHSRSVTGKKQPTNLNELTNEYLMLAYHAAQAKDPAFAPQLSTQFTPNPGTTYIVHQEIGRVLLNLFNNAFYALRKKWLANQPNYQPALRVCTLRSVSSFDLIVEDNGVGIPAAVQPKIFQPFFTTKPTGEGTGLGLSLSYDIVTKSYGGTFRVESDGKNFTRFTIVLPNQLFVNPD